MRLIVAHQSPMLAEALGRLLQDLGLTVVAEGIEDSQQRDTLVGMGCDLGQGFLFAKPLRPGDVVRVLDERGVIGAGGPPPAGTGPDDPPQAQVFRLRA